MLGADFDGAGQSDREVMAAVLDETVADDASDDYVRAGFDAATASSSTETAPEGEGNGERADGGNAPRVKLVAGGELPPEGKDRIRADNAKWEADAPTRFAMTKQPGRV